jgi:hypothetical protein
MNTACTPSQVIRDGFEVNQHGQAGRHEHASSKSPAIFQVGFFAAAESPAIVETQTPNTNSDAVKMCRIIQVVDVITFEDSIILNPDPLARIFPKKFGLRRVAPLSLSAPKRSTPPHACATFRQSSAKRRAKSYIPLGKNLFTQNRLALKSPRRAYKSFTIIPSR